MVAMAASTADPFLRKIFLPTSEHGPASEATAAFLREIIEMIKTICIAPFEVCEVSAAGKISDYQPRGPGFNSRIGRQGLNYGRPSFATPSAD